MSDHEKNSVKVIDYHAYLLRIWREEGYGWRISLQPSNSSERFGFADLQAAMNFVENNLYGKESLNEIIDG
ncbi:MAG: hypothetical protein R3E31_08050 [Chloroflexota bacterium]|nr:hypothetical protein [Anaerolineales bacterium]MCA9974446.1 hypothetical protein [Anaerolineales bacterium]